MSGARFLASHALPIASRSLFFVPGHIMDGEIRMGRTARAAGFSGTIQAVEVADRITPPRSWVAPGFRFADAAQLECWTLIA